jgi:hypothetical protein
MIGREFSNDHHGETTPGLVAAVAPAASPFADETVTVAATVGVVAVGVASFEVAMLPGMAIGVAAMLAPKYVPKMGTVLTPMFKSTVKGIYKFGQKTREGMAETKEQVHDILAEVHPEDNTTKAASKAPAEAQKA